MNNCFRNLCRIEFPVTFLCTGRCKHCSVAERSEESAHIDGAAASGVIKKLSERFKITSVMTFGGEPLLFPDTVCMIHSAARDCNIQRRELITNGYFTNSRETVVKTAERLVKSGCSRILISADAFHQEYIPIEWPLFFAIELKKLPCSVKVQPAWISSREADNPYDRKTSEIISAFESNGIGCNEGNTVFPEGNALKYLADYFEPGKEYINPYSEDPSDVRTVSVEPDGGVLGGNIYKQDIIEIIEKYKG